MSSAIRYIFYDYVNFRRFDSQILIYQWGFYYVYMYMKMFVQLVSFTHIYICQLSSLLYICLKEELFHQILSKAQHWRYIINKFFLFPFGQYHEKDFQGHSKLFLSTKNQRGNCHMSKVSSKSPLCLIVLQSPSKSFRIFQSPPVSSFLLPQRSRPVQF